jgi:hypothetical protein
VVDEYVSCVELHAERPWMRSLDCFLGQKGHLILSSLSFAVSSVVFLEGNGHDIASGN